MSIWGNEKVDGIMNEAYYEFMRLFSKSNSNLNQIVENSEISDSDKLEKIREELKWVKVLDKQMNTMYSERIGNVYLKEEYLKFGVNNNNGV